MKTKRIFWRSTALWCAVSPALLCGISCKRVHPLRIAVIPRTTGTQLWETEHNGVDLAVQGKGMQIYWNAPTREDDVERQIELVEKVVEEHYDGLILAPDQALALIAPVRRALDSGLKVVIVSSSLPIEPQGNLHFILNDDAETGRLAAERIGKLLGGRGTVAILGVDTKLTSIVRKVKAFKEVLREKYPAVDVVAVHPGAFNHSQAQQIALDTLNEHPSLGAIFAMTTSATQGAFEALDGHHNSAVKLVGCEQDLDLEDAVRTGQIDSLLIENTFVMGYDGVKWLSSSERAEQSEAIQLRPLLLTKENFKQVQAEQSSIHDWSPR
jgi:ribose transport system substrate-binding protein